MDEEFPTACSLFALVPYVVVDIISCFIGSEFLNQNCNPTIIQFCNSDTLLW